MGKKIVIKTDECGQGSITIDGKDISMMVHGFSVDSNARKHTNQITLLLDADTEIELETENINLKRGENGI